MCGGSNHASRSFLTKSRRARSNVAFECSKVGFWSSKLDFARAKDRISGVIRSKHGCADVIDHGEKNATDPCNREVSIFVCTK